MADEDPQTVHGLVAAKQLKQQLLVGAQIDVVKNLDRMLGWRSGAKYKPYGPEINRSAEVHPIAHRREALEIGKETRHRYLHRPVDDDADRGGTEIVHYEHDRVREHGIGQGVSRNDQDRGERLIVRGGCWSRHP